MADENFFNNFLTYMDDLLPGSVEKVFGPTLAQNAGLWVTPDNAEEKDGYDDFKKECSKQQLEKVLKKKKDEPNNKFGILGNNEITENIVNKEICQPAITGCYNFKAQPDTIKKGTDGNPVWDTKKPIKDCFQTLADMNFESRTFTNPQKTDEEETPDEEPDEEETPDEDPDEEPDEEETPDKEPDKEETPDEDDIPDYVKSTEDSAIKKENRKVIRNNERISKQLLGDTQNATVMCSRDRETGKLVLDNDGNPVPKGCIKECITANNPVGCKFICDKDGKPDGCFDNKKENDYSGTGIKYGDGAMEAHQKRDATEKLNIPTYTSSISYLTFDPNISSYKPDKKPVLDNYKQMLNSHIKTLETEAVSKCNKMCGDPIYNCNYYTVKKQPTIDKADAENKVKRMQEELFFTDFGKWVDTDNGASSMDEYKKLQEQRGNNTYGYASGSPITNSYPYEYKCFNIGAKPSGGSNPKKHCVNGADGKPINPYTPNMCNEVSGNWTWCEQGKTSNCLTK